MADTTEKPTTNDSFADENEQQDDSASYKPKQNHRNDEITLFTVLNNLVTATLFPRPGTKYASASLLHRIKTSVSENVPLLRGASKNTAHRVLQWTRHGSPLRALFVVSVGTIILLALTAVLAFVLFFVTATINAIVISLLMSLAAAGGFLAFFFACVTAIYIGALLVAVCVISAGTISAIIATLVVAGWIGFFWAVWLAVKKSVSLAKRSLSITGSALSSYSSARQSRHQK